MAPLLDRVEALVGLARSAASEGGATCVAARDELDAMASRLHEPLRVALAGRIKAGKSTLLNALVGERLAPTDAGECTRVVTWYREGIGYRASLVLRDGTTVPAVVRRGEGAVEVELDAHCVEEVIRIEVDWPAPALRTTTLIDTPGLGSLSGISSTTVEFLAADDNRPTEADAVIYLTRHLHGADVGFLEAFHDRTGARSTPLNAIGVLSRADEIGGGRADSLQSAGRIAERYRRDPTFRRYCQTVVPVAGLLAEAAASFTEAEHRALGRLATLDDDRAEGLLASADRFVDPETVCGLAPEERRHLIDRMGLFGVRLGRDLIRHGHADSARVLADELRRRSGLEELRRVLATTFTARRDLLKSQAALVALADLLHRHRLPGDEALRAELERIEAGAHQLAELRVLTAVRGGEIALTDQEANEVERLFGAGDAATRTGAAGADDTELRDVVVDAVQRWRRRAESPLSSPAVVAAAAVVTRTYEWLLVAEEVTT